MLFLTVCIFISFYLNIEILIFFTLPAGTSPSAKKIAAQQIGDIQKKHPYDLHNLLHRAHIYLHHKDWETRIAAGEVINAIASNVPEWKPPETYIKKEDDANANNENDPFVFYDFDNFDVNDVLKNGTILLEKDDISTNFDLISSSNSLKRSSQSLAKSRDDLQTKSVITEQPKDDNKIVIENVIDIDRAYENLNEWPFERICKDFKEELNDSAWIIRHGAAIGLREILKFHARSAGKSAGLTDEQQQNAHYKWHIDCSIRLLQLLILDRFSDFSDDVTVSPVRETAAQVLAIVYTCLNDTYLSKILDILIILMSQSKWEVRHSGLLALKYLFAVKPDFITKHIDKVMPLTIKLIGNHEDDVRMAAGEALLSSVKAGIPFKAEYIESLYNELWPALNDLDEVSSSTKVIMELLSELYSRNIFVDRVDSTSENRVIELIPKLWVFFRHNVKTVRKAALDTLLKMIKTNESTHNQWVPYIIEEALVFLYQNFILEERSNIIELTRENWNKLLDILSTDHNFYLPYFNHIIDTHLARWLQLAISYRNTPINTELLLRKDGDLFESGVMDRKESDVEMQLEASRSLAYFIRKCPQICIQKFEHLFIPMLSSYSANERQVASFIIYFLTIELSKEEIASILSESFIKMISQLESPNFFFAEVTPIIHDMRNEYHILINSFINSKVKIENLKNASEISPDDAQKFITTQYNELIKHIPDEKPKNKLPTLREKFNARRQILEKTLQNLETYQDELQISTSAAIASLIISTKSLPDKVSGIINPLMKSIKREKNSQLQVFSSEAISHLLFSLTSKSPNACNMILKNLSNLLILDMNFGEEELEEESSADEENGKKRKTELTESGTKKRKVSEKKPPQEIKVELPPVINENTLSRKGAELSFKHIPLIFGNQLFEKLPYLWNFIHDTLTSNENIDDNTLMVSLRTLESIMPYVHDDLKTKIESSLINSLILKVSSESSKIRNLASRTLSTTIKYTLPKSMNYVLKSLLPLLEDQKNLNSRRGASLALNSIVKDLGLLVIPYSIFFIVPILGRMSDQDLIVRKQVAYSFATLVKLLPLEANLPDPEGIEPEFISQRHRERSFLEQLLGGKKSEHYDLAIKINTELRQYQQEGVNWLAFLNKYNLQGILADDMGLGKTLQTICIISSDFHKRRTMWLEKKTPNYEPLPSLVVCPSTLVGHWANEVHKFCDKSITTLQIKGPPAERTELRKKILDSTIVIMSYDVLRNDIKYLTNYTFNYCVLDEGHIIRNASSRITKALKLIKSNHRLILTGTPIQNNVLELWSLFDFLMPGFLGNEKQFKELYSKPILASKGAKASSKEQERGMLALESLHRQVLPFILRRMKEDVLQDLPPKIIQDVNVDLCELQVELYEDFGKTSGKLDTNSKGHIFQSLQYLRKLCTHPKLILNEKHPKYSSIMSKLKAKGESIDDIKNSPKLVALKQLLFQCGIGEFDHDLSNTGDALMQDMSSQHRVLIFTQFKQTIDIIENDLFKKEMPSVTYMRLDGDVNQYDRFSLVEKFNSDPTIDVLLLTVSVGGLGLNLTGADTVIFMEHDWNPQNDIQAMDRAHRIGQTKTVNVYRLITKGTLEEKVMGIQKFKLNIANSVVNKDNQSFESMNSNQLFDLFKLSEESITKDSETEELDEFGNIKKKSESGLSAVLKELENMGDEDQYTEEYNLENFLEKLK